MYIAATSVTPTSKQWQIIREFTFIHLRYEDFKRKKNCNKIIIYDAILSATLERKQTHTHDVVVQAFKTLRSQCFHWNCTVFDFPTHENILCVRVYVFSFCKLILKRSPPSLIPFHMQNILIMITILSISNRNEFNQRFGITTAFLATHSGLTRWMNFQKPNNNYVADSRPEYVLLHIICFPFYHFR